MAQSPALAVDGWAVVVARLATAVPTEGGIFFGSGLRVYTTRAKIALVGTLLAGGVRSARPGPNAGSARTRQARGGGENPLLAGDGGQARRGGRKAAAFLIEEFRRLKLEPLFQGQFVQEIPAAAAAAQPPRMQGRNVGAVCVGPTRPCATSG